MKITGALVSTAALLVLGSLPLSAKAQCGVGYGDYAVNAEEGTIDAWTYVAEYVNPECPWYYAYQYGYYDHHYSVSAEISSPTQNSAYDGDYQIVPYGGGSAVAFTSISYLGDSGVYDIDWFIEVLCTIGGTLIYWLDDVVVETPPDWTLECDEYAPRIWLNFQPRSLYIRGLYNMYTAANTFYFQFAAELHNASPQEATEFSAGADEWTKVSISCAYYGSWENIETTAPEEGDVQVFYVSNGELPAGVCGHAQRFGETGSAKDFIEIMKANQRAYCDDHRIETVYHEIGHLLGFYHVPPQEPGGLANIDLFTDPRPNGPGPRVIESHHIRTLFESY